MLKAYDKQLDLRATELMEPLGLYFAEEPKEVPQEMMATTSQWISDPNTKDWDFDQD